MTTVDKILIKILAQPEGTFSQVSFRDMKVLKSLGKIVTGQSFITENQGKLLIKILSENLEKFEDFSQEISESLVVPSWTKVFRPIDKTKKMYIKSTTYGFPELVVEFAFSSSLRKTLLANSKKIAGLAQQANGKIYHADLTEQNIVSLVELLEPLEFDIDEKIQDFYKTIKSWSENEVKNQFLITNITHTNFQKSISEDLGIDTPLTESLIKDRSMRYQYFVEKSEKNPENLTEKIAYRKNAKVWVNKTEIELDEIFASLINLRRLPTLLIFDHNDHKRCFEELVNLHENLEKNRIFDGVGIYFRLPNDEYGEKFNKFIADHGYNAELNSSTKIVGVQNGKIPKFFLKNDWKPMSVISIGSSLKQTKTAVYANLCDLIISYTEQQPIIESRILWE